MRVILLGLVIATVVDSSLGQSVPWSNEDAANTKKLADVGLPNPVCSTNFDCNKIKAVVNAIANAKHPGNTKISDNCMCLPTNDGPMGCSCTYNYNSKTGAHEAYEESVWFGNGGIFHSQFRTLPLN
ncbi:hypothetical protein WDU94_004267 [Cyamophila willieti]